MHARIGMLGLVVAWTIAAAPAAEAQQSLSWDNYCTVSGSLLCSSIQLNLTPDAGGTDFSIMLRNLEGSLGTTPWSLYNVAFNGLETTVPLSLVATPTFQAVLSGSADYLVTADAATCASNLKLGGCPGPNWGNVEWDWTGAGQVGSHIDNLPKPFGIVGCDAPVQPDPSTSYWGGGYFQTCGDGWVDFNFTLPGSWMFDAASTVSIVTYDGANFSNCTFDQTCLETSSMTATPEPATIGLLATGLFAVGGLTQRRRRRKRLLEN
jgi:hypothetical protein